MVKQQAITKQERRKHRDFWVYLAKSLAIAAWILFIFALVMSFYAAPESNYGVLRYHGIEIRRFWLTPLTGYLYILLWFSALVSYACLFIDKYRKRRKTDNKHFNLVLLLIITIAWVIYILIQILKLK